MKTAYAAAEALLREAVQRLALPCPERIPLRLEGKTAVLMSALPRLLGAKTGADPEKLAARLAKAAVVAYPFDGVQASGSMLLLPLSRPWMEDVLAGYAGEIPPMPPRQGVRRCDREDKGFLLDYTARRCALLSRQEGGGDVPPPALVCLLAQEQPDAVAVAKAFWALSPARRRNPALARAVGRCAAGFTKNSPCFVPVTI